MQDNVVHINSGFVHVREGQIQRFFKDMYQQIQGLNTEEKGLEIKYKHAKSIQQNVRFVNVKQFQKISKN